jgi:hypothetical protein
MMNLLSKQQWFSKLEAISIPFQRYGDFLPEQRMLLEKVHATLATSQKPVLIFVAPTASGKTHAICLIAKILQENLYDVAILVPNNYLKEEYKRAQQDVRGQLTDIDFLTISQYLRTSKQYHFVLADEAHNLKTFLELDGKIVKTINLTKNDELFFDITSRYLPPNKSFVAKQLSFNSASDLLMDLSTVPKFAKCLKPVIKNPTSWTTFIYVWGQSEMCSIKFVKSSDSLCKLKLPIERTLMFSASPLSDQELYFYCGISKEHVERVPPVKPMADWRTKQSVFFSLIDELDSNCKLTFLEDIIRETRTKTLVLFNRYSDCKEAFKKLNARFNNITLVPPASLRTNLNTFTEFQNIKNGVLLTASTIFWEGITINVLKLVIITDPPYPRPTLIDLVKNKRNSGRHDIARRLEQGLGRIARRKGDYGIGLLLFDINKHCKEFQNTIEKNRLLRLKSHQYLLELHKIFEDNSPSLDSYILSKC